MNVLKLGGLWILMVFFIYFIQTKICQIKRPGPSSGSLNLSDGSDTWNRIFGYLENENWFKYFNIFATLDIS